MHHECKYSNLQQIETPGEIIKTNKEDLLGNTGEIECGLFEVRGETSVGVKGGKVCSPSVPSCSQVLFVLSASVSALPSSPIATIRQLQSVAAGNKLEFSSLVRVTFFFNTQVFCCLWHYRRGKSLCMHAKQKGDNWKGFSSSWVTAKRFRLTKRQDLNGE